MGDDPEDDNLKRLEPLFSERWIRKMADAEDRCTSVTAGIGPEGEPMNVPNDVPQAVVMDLTKRFTYHALKEGQPLTYQQIREAAKSFALLLAGLCPDSRERSLAITHLEEVVFWANASIARKP